MSDPGSIHTRLLTELKVGHITACEYVERGVTSEHIDEWVAWMKRPGKSKALALHLMRSGENSPPPDEPMTSSVPPWAEKGAELYRVWSDLWPSGRKRQEEWERLYSAVSKFPASVVRDALRRIRQNEDQDYRGYREVPQPGRVKSVVKELLGLSAPTRAHAGPVVSLRDVLSEEGASSLAELVERRKKALP